MQLDINYPSFLGGEQRLDYNVYDATASDRVFVINSASHKPSPWTSDEFLGMLRAATGAQNLVYAKGKLEGRIPMTFKQWKAFWNSHNFDVDRNSILVSGNNVAYRPESRELIMDISFEPTSVGSKNHARMDLDYFGNNIPQDSSALPGPFQTLKKGVNKFVVWKGLPIIGRGELPDPAEFSSFEKSDTDVKN